MLVKDTLNVEILVKIKCYETFFFETFYKINTKIY